MAFVGSLAPGSFSKVYCHPVYVKEKPLPTTQGLLGGWGPPNTPTHPPLLAPPPPPLSKALPHPLRVFGVGDSATLPLAKVQTGSCLLHPPGRPPDLASAAPPARSSSLALVGAVECEQGTHSAWGWDTCSFGTVSTNAGMLECLQPRGRRPTGDAPLPWKDLFADETGNPGPTAAINTYNRGRVCGSGAPRAYKRMP